MFELVPSKWMKKYLEDNKRVFTDWEKATLIWNSPVHTWNEKLAALKEFSDIARDELLQQQLEERIQYEEKSYRRLVDNAEKKYVYVVFDNEHSPYGFFADFEQARKYAVYVSKEYECRCYIEKQLIFSEDTKADVIHRLSSNSSTDNETELDMGYEGDENAIAGLFEDGSIKYIYSHELPEEEAWIEERSEERFEYQFIKIPFGMQQGMIVKMVDDGSYGVLAVDEEDWDQYLQEIEARNLQVDYSDIQVIVYQLMENGHWSHQHINPLYLEPQTPVVEEGNEESRLLENALTALSLYFEEKNVQNSEQVLQTARAYAEKKERNFFWARIVCEAKSAEDILF